MISHRQRQLPLSRFRLTLSVCCAIGIFACASQDLVLTGSWGSTEITHPSPFFPQTLAPKTHGTLRLFLNPSGEFMWLEPEGVCHSGTYLIQANTLLLTESQGGERIRLDYAIRGDQLRLKTPDGFMFDFRRAPHQADAGAKPCNR